ncbi:flavin oxidoreductase [Lottiidibacillus patelloidae]|uniref:Flavin oxidoreductase n=1 Tax=Lottiidibacillus patelloidae TaxID=2670334 RepID=A0A263BQU2_9BACI|nr:flavin reductase family protein [Lottiidibacillus patelloidae]OZM56065.1 flavin oxidoreductase [Lottiidibacillus patelloidae]
MLKQTKTTVMHSYPGMVALVTAQWNGTKNIMAAGWHTYISYEPPIYGVAIGEERFTHHLIKESKEFAIQFVSADHANAILKAGTETGANGDKFQKLGISFISGVTIKCPILTDAYVAYECKLIDVNTYGDHDFFVGEITGFHRDDEKFTEEGLPNFEKLNIPLYLGRSKFLVADNNTKQISHKHS